MKHIVRLSCPADPLFSPWPLIVADTRYPDVLTVQDPSPHAGDNLIGFERDHGDVEVSTHEADWPERCIGLYPVFAHSGRMYALRGYIVEAVENDDPVEIEAPCTS